MELKYILLIVLLVIYPLVKYYGTYSKSSIIDQPLIFHNPLFVLFGNLSTLVFIAICIWLAFVSWKTLLLVFLIVMVVGFIKGYIGRTK